jgi:hypothetical protein
MQCGDQEKANSRQINSEFPAVEKEGGDDREEKKPL